MAPSTGPVVGPEHQQPPWSPLAALRRRGRALLAPLLGPYLGGGPSARLIRETACRQWRLLVVNLSCSLLQAVSEGATFGVVFLAVELLSNSRQPSAVVWASKPLIGLVPGLAPWLAGLPMIPLFLGLLGLAVLLQALQSLSAYVGQVSLGYFAARCRARITERIHSQILALSFPCASRYRVGDLVDHAVQGPEGIRLQFEATNQILITLLLIGAYLVILLTLSPWLLLAAAFLAGLMGWLQRVLLPRLTRNALRVAAIQAEVAARLTEDIQALRLLHTSGRREEARRALEARMGELEAGLRHQARLLYVAGPFSAFLPIAAVALMGALSLLLLGGRSSGVLPSLITFVLALQRLNVRFSALSQMTNLLADNAGRIHRLNSLLESGNKEFSRQGGVPFAGLEREIRLEKVRLTYPGEGPPALNGVDLVIPKGSTVALVGPSGSGKSSLVDLLVGLYEPTGGRVLVDGVDLRELDLASWQRSLGVVSQDPFLFNASLRENIAFGCPGASEAEVRQAARRAQVSGVIDSLPEGYATVVGERGFRLSGGQRQRVALARALLGRRELLILDEATSALDTESERLVQEALRSLAGGQTVLLVAHRLSTVVEADRIVVLREGAIVESGSHRQLLERRGLYHRLWSQQTHAGGGVRV